MTDGRMQNGTANGHGPNGIKLVNYEGLLRLFECVGCKGWVTPPIHHCRKGHLVCGGCRTTMKANSCPGCKQRLQETPNLAMEQVAATIAFPCRYQQQGCADCLFLDSKASHEAFCSFRPVPCQYSSNGCKEVLEFQEMVDHVKTCQHRFNRQTSVVTLTTNITTTHTEVRRVASFASRFKSKKSTE